MRPVRCQFKVRRSMLGIVAVAIILAGVAIPMRGLRLADYHLAQAWQWEETATHW